MLSFTKTFQLPLEFDADFYRSEYADLAHLDSTQLIEHYHSFGLNECRLPNSIRDRKAFANLIPETADTLEIGPFFAPMTRGPNVKYFDVLSQSQLTERAKSLGYTEAKPPRIDFISPNGDLSIVNQSFDFVVSSYCFEHQPDLIKHLQDVDRILAPGGFYLALVPDKRFCHDHFMAESTIAGVLDSHHTHRVVHPLRSVIEHRAFLAHNDHWRHWNGDHGEQFPDMDDRIQSAVAEHSQSAGRYIDVHSWYFTPESVRHILKTLRRLRYVGLECVRCYETRKYQNDFWLALQKTTIE